MALPSVDSFNHTVWNFTSPLRRIMLDLVVWLFPSEAVHMYIFKMMKYRMVPLPRLPNIFLKMRRFREISDKIIVTSRNIGEN
jgi:hypothetical protein